MRIAMACDHAGYQQKLQIADWLKSQGHEVEDFGCHSEEAADLPDFVYPASLAVSNGSCERAILVDGVGYGSAMIANKLPNVYAAVCQDPVCADLARSHSDSNVLCLGAKLIGPVLAMAVVETWMTVEWLGTTQEKYARRVQKIKDIATKHVHA